ncbi:hypothetical protein B0H14DRAFT_3654766 [Mycena olivaceomarginata]|nr:hypothetical protein B0H14DRAFT_3654766 [Mycena olivaceomarginata]
MGHWHVTQSTLAHDALRTTGSSARVPRHSVSGQAGGAVTLALGFRDQDLTHIKTSPLEDWVAEEAPYLAQEASAPYSNNGGAARHNAHTLHNTGAAGGGSRAVPAWEDSLTVVSDTTKSGRERRRQEEPDNQGEERDGTHRSPTELISEGPTGPYRLGAASAQAEVPIGDIQSSSDGDVGRQPDDHETDEDSCDGGQVATEREAQERGPEPQQPLSRDRVSRGAMSFTGGNAGAHVPSVYDGTADFDKFERWSYEVDTWIDFNSIPTPALGLQVPATCSRYVC